jgi:signal transduction histidine kinase
MSEQRASGSGADGVDEVISDLLSEASRRWERALFIARFLFCIFIILRQVVTWHSSPEASQSSRVWLTLPALIGLTLYLSLTVLVARSKMPIERMVLFSVALDALGAFLALAMNAFFPWKGYPGLINMPDTVGVILMAFIAGLRLSPAAALLGGVLNSCSLALLVFIDLKISGIRPTDQLVLYGLFLSGATAVSTIVAVRTRNLVARGAQAAVAAERARQSFGAILHEHHDVRTLLSAARLDADLLSRKLESPEKAGRGAEQLVADLRGGLHDVEARIEAIRAQAHGELLALEERHAVDVAGVAEDVLARVARRFPAVSLTLSALARRKAWVAGGGPTLRRILFNLIINGCEGDGERGATRVEVGVRADLEPGRVSLEVVDDGPGFSPESLRALPGQAASTKEGGWGFGLGVASALVEASHGTLTRKNRESGGAAVLVSLPVVE